MSPAAKVARLQALLERVRTRASGGEGLLQSVRPAPPAAPAEMPAMPPMAAIPAHAMPTPAAPAVAAASRRAIDTASEPEIDFVVQETVIDLSEPFDDAPPARAAEGRTAAPAVPPLAPDDLDDELSGPPSSSRRVIAAEPEEQLSEMAFGAGDLPPPRHTPPPESGRLPAAPDADLEPEITLDASEVDITSVRPAAPTPVPADAEESAALAPQVTRGTMPSAGFAPGVVGKAQELAPGTFLELLDASLGL
jgi:hypothetical protein